MFKKFVRIILLFLIGFSLVILFDSLVVTTPVRPEKIKSWAASSNIYSSVVDGFITQATQEQNDPNGANSSSLANPAIQAAARKAVTPQLVQTSIESIVDGTFHWLDGKTNRPDFRIDLTAAKTTFATEAAQAAKARVLSLPSCPPRQFPSGTDPFEISCRPTANVFDVNIETAKYQQQLLTNKDFLPDTVLTADNLVPKTDKNSSDTQNFFANQRIPKIYQLAMKVPLILGGFLAITTLLYLFLSAKRLDGVRMVGITLLVAAFISGLFLAVAQRGVDKAHESITQQHPQSAIIAATKSSIASIIDSAGVALSRNGLQVIEVYAATGAVLIGASVVIQHKQKLHKKQSLQQIVENSDKNELSSDSKS